MKLRRSAVAFFVLATVAAAAAQAQAGNTREQVLRELAEARRMGDIMAPGCGGGTLREAFPERYPARPAAANAGPIEAQRSAVGRALQPAHATRGATTTDPSPLVVR